MHSLLVVELVDLQTVRTIDIAPAHLLDEYR